MKNKEFDKKREIKREVLVYEKWETVETKFGRCNVVRYWSSKEVEVAGKIEEVMDLLGYRGHLRRNIMGNICVRPEEAVDSVVSVYEHELEKQKKIIENM